MNSHFFKTIICYNFKLQLRNLVPQVFFLFILLATIFFHVRNQSNLSKVNTSYIFTLASFIPFMNAYIFSILQVIPMIFIATSVLDKRKRVDTMDAIYYRPESNMEYLWGNSLAIILVFSIIGILSLCFAALVHLFASDAYFNIGDYIYYFFILLLPSVILTYGFSLFISSIVRSRLLCTTILLICFSFTIVYLSNYQQGLFDPLGISLPNARSEIIGRMEFTKYLLQRGCWLFLGLGFIQLAVLKFKRLSNNPMCVKIRVSMAFFLIFMGLFLGLSFFMINKKKLELRHEYALTYTKYSDQLNVTLLSQDIKYTQQDKQMFVNSQLRVQNQTDQVLNEFILYLNPGLEIIILETSGENILFDRENQVVRLHYAIFPNDTLNIDIIYKGDIDENICYLDISDEMMFDTKTRGYMTCYFEKKYAFLEKEFTLLIPEILWYPVTVPPVNPENPYNIDKNYSYYKLQVTSSEGKSVISQGEKEVLDNEIIFKNSTPLPGISLCIGEYETTSVYVDSVYCELNIFKRKSSLFGLLKCKDKDLSFAKHRIESTMQFCYPYKKFVVTETPIAYTSYYRNNQGGSEYIQPELIFFPEKGTNIFVKYDSVDAKKLLFDFTGALLAQTGDRGTFSWKEQLGIFDWNMESYLSKFQFENNPYYISSMFLNANPYFYSSIYPINAIINNIIYYNNEDVNDILASRDKSKVAAIEYLNNSSLQQALLDKNISETIKSEILMLKTKELLNLFHHEGIFQDSIQTFMIDFLKKNKFNRINFTSFDSVFECKYNITWEKKLFSWNTSNQLPKYFVKYFDVYQVEMPNTNGTDELFMMVRFSVYNDSKVDGIVNLLSIDEIGGRTNVFSSGQKNIEPLNISFEIKAQTGRKVALLVRRNKCAFRLDLNYSSNIPSWLIAACDENVLLQNAEEFSLVIDRNEYFNNFNELVVDNEAQGCVIYQSGLIPKLVNYFHKSDRFSQYTNLTSFVSLNDHWQTILDYNAYGEIYKSVILRLAGKGKTNIDWSVRLPKDGKYEIYVYIPKLQYHNILRTLENPNFEIGIQQYRIYLQDSVRTVEVDICDKKGWLSLGAYEYQAGVQKISLSDIGIPDQIIIADAVKWIYIE